jgi:hypothetical protein
LIRHLLFKTGNNAVEFALLNERGGKRESFLDAHNIAVSCNPLILANNCNDIPASGLNGLHLHIHSLEMVKEKPLINVHSKEIIELISEAPSPYNGSFDRHGVPQKAWMAAFAAMTGWGS